MAVNDQCKLTLAWNAAAPGDPSSPYMNAPYTTPSVAGDVVYFGTGLAQGLHAVDAAKGTLLWSATTRSATFAQPTVANGVVLVGDWSSGVSRLYAFGL